MGLIYLFTATVLHSNVFLKLDRPQKELENLLLWWQYLLDRFPFIFSDCDVISRADMYLNANPKPLLVPDITYKEKLLLSG
jgi:hypothetical protein